MKKLQMVAIDEIELTDVPMPEPKAGEVLLKTRGAAVFRSEFIPLIHGEDPRTREGTSYFPRPAFHAASAPIWSPKWWTSDPRSRT